MNKKRVFSISIQEKGQQTEEVFLKRSFMSSKFLTIGNKRNCDIIVPLINGRQRLLERCLSGYNLLIRADMKGDITIGGRTVPVNWFIEFGQFKKSGKYYIIPLQGKGTCTLSSEDIALTFSYKEIVIPEKKTVKLDSSLKKPWINREDYSFHVTLVLLAAIHFTSVNFLSTIEVKQKEHLDVLLNIPERFAKLIFRPPKKKIIEIEAIKPKPEEESEDIEEEEPEEEPPPPEPEPEPEEVTPPEPEETPPPPVLEEKIEQPPEVEDTSLSPQPEPLSPAEKRELIRKKVKSKGILGVIMAKARTKDNFETGVFRDIDKLAAGVDKDKQGTSDEDVLASLDMKSLKTLQEIPEQIIKTNTEIDKNKITEEIIGEKKEVLLEEEDELKEETDEEEESDFSTHMERSEAGVHKTILKYIGGLKFLYNNALKNDPLLKGNITVKMIISPDGKIKIAEKVSSTIDLPELEEAIIKRIYRWRFTALAYSVDFTINYTFDFSPVS